MACSFGFYGDGISFQVVFSQSFWLRVLPGGARLVQPRWMPERRILGGGRTGGVSFDLFPNSSGWWRLISSLFLTRTSCCKTTHANGYYGAWPGWAVSVSVLPLTKGVQRSSQTLDQWSINFFTEFFLQSYKEPLHVKNIQLQMLLLGNSIPLILPDQIKKH